MRKASLASYLDLFDKLSLPVILLDDSFREVDHNDAAISFLNQKELSSLIADEKYKKILRICLRNYYPKDIETILTDGRHVKLTICSLDLKNEKILQIIIYDISKEKELLEKLENLTITDELTGLYNVRFYNQEIKKIESLYNRTKSPFGIILFDIDNFKNYNDTNGHIEGDKLLKEMGRILKDISREEDICCRYGGEEFIIICPNTNKEGLYLLAERIRLKIAGYPFNHREKQPLGIVSVSIGVATLEDSKNVDELKKIADDRLYLSKKSGRNRVS